MVTETVAVLADEMGLPHLSMSVVAERLGDELRDSMHGRAGRDALEAAAQTVRKYIQQRPGRYAATVGIPATGPDDHSPLRSSAHWNRSRPPSADTR